MAEMEWKQRYDETVAYVRRTIPKRGKIFEAARPAFESGEYVDSVLETMIREGVIVPSLDPNGGYVLPSPPKE